MEQTLDIRQDPWERGAPKTRSEASVCRDRTRDALAGEDVVIASNGERMVKLVSVARKGHLRGWGRLKRFRAAIDAAFTPELDEQIAKSLEAGCETAP